MKTRLFLVVALFFSSIGVIAQPLADRLPADTLLYLGWRGADSPGAGFDGSHLKAVLDATNAAQFCNEFLPALVKRAAMEHRDLAEALPVISSMAATFWKHPTALYFGALELPGNGQPPMPRIALLCDAGADAPALLDHLNAVLAHTPPAPLKLAAKMQNGVVALTAGNMTAAFDQSLAGGAKENTLAAAKAFQSAFTQLQVDPVAAVYLDFEGLVGQLDQAMATHPSEQSRAQWGQIRDFLGLKGLKQFAAAGGFDGKDWATSVFLGAPAPRAGLLAMFDSAPLAADVMKVVPKTATWAAAGKLNLVSSFNALRELAGQAPGGREQFDQGIQQVSLGFGIDIQKDLLGAFGEDWVIYTDPAIGGQGLLGFVIVNHLSDAGKAEATFSKVEQIIFQILQANMRNAKVQINMQQAKAGDVTLHYLAVPVVSPTWAVTGGNLYLGLFPQVVSSGADFGASHGPSLLENDGFKAIVARLSEKAGAARPTSLSFADLPRTAPQGYATWVALSRGVAMADLFAIPSPAMLLPPLHKLMPQLTPAGSMTWSDDAGLHARALSPFPGAEIISTDPMGGAALTAPLAASVLLPSLSKARETANKVKCASNLRMIGQGCLLYANDNTGKLPPDLGALFLGDYLSAAVVICPDGHAGSPPAGATREQVAAWMNNADYVYLGAGKKNNTPADVVICYEKPENHRTGMNVLFGDGHVDFVQTAEAMQIIQQQGGAQKQ